MELGLTNKLESVLRLQKCAVRMLYPVSYILKASLYSCCVLTLDRDVLEYDTRGRDVLRIHQHRTVLYKQLPKLNGL